MLEANPPCVEGEEKLAWEAITRIGGMEPNNSRKAGLPAKDHFCKLAV